MLSYEVGAIEFICDHSERQLIEKIRDLDEMCDGLSYSTTANRLPDSFVRKKKFQLRKPTGVKSSKGEARCQAETLADHPTDPNRGCEDPRLRAAPRTRTHRVANKLSLKRPRPMQGDQIWVGLPDSTQVYKSDQSFVLRSRTLSWPAGASKLILFDR